MLNAIRGDLSHKNGGGKELHSQTEKTQERALNEAEGGYMAQSVEDLQRELTRAILVRDKALSFIVAIRREKEFFQHIGLTCTPDFEERVEKQMQEMADLYLRQQEVYKRMEGKQ